MAVAKISYRTGFRGGNTHHEDLTIDEEYCKTRYENSVFTHLSGQVWWWATRLDYMVSRNMTLTEENVFVISRHKGWTEGSCRFDGKFMIIGEETKKVYDVISIVLDNYIITKNMVKICDFGEYIASALPIYYAGSCVSLDNVQRLCGVIGRQVRDIFDKDTLSKLRQPTLN